MAFVTYVPRLLPLITLSRVELPKLIEKWLNYVPISVFSALLFPSLLLKEGSFNLGFNNYQVWAGLICLLTIWKSRNLALTVSAGIIAFLIFGFI